NQRSAVDDPRLRVPRAFREPCLTCAGAAATHLCPRMADASRDRPRREGGNQRPVHSLHSALRIEELVLAQIGLVEGGNSLGAIACIDWAGGQFEADVESLTSVAHLRVARPLRLGAIDDAPYVGAGPRL